MLSRGSMADKTAKETAFSNLPGDVTGMIAEYLSTENVGAFDSTSSARFGHGVLVNRMLVYAVEQVRRTVALKRHYLYELAIAACDRLQYELYPWGHDTSPKLLVVNYPADLSYTICTPNYAPSHQYMHTNIVRVFSINKYTRRGPNDSSHTTVVMRVNRSTRTVALQQAGGADAKLLHVWLVLAWLRHVLTIDRGSPTWFTTVNIANLGDTAYPAGARWPFSPPGAQRWILTGDPDGRAENQPSLKGHTQLNKKYNHLKLQPPKYASIGRLTTPRVIAHPR